MVKKQEFRRVTPLRETGLVAVTHKFELKVSTCNGGFSYFGRPVPFNYLNKCYYMTLYSFQSKVNNKVLLLFVVVRSHLLSQYFSAQANYIYFDNFVT